MKHKIQNDVVICFHFSIFEPLETTLEKIPRLRFEL